MLYICYVMSFVMIFTSFLFFTLRIKDKISGYRNLSVAEREKINMKGLCCNIGILFFICGIIWFLAGFSVLFRTNFLTGAIFLWICTCILDITAINKFKLYRKQ